MREKRSTFNVQRPTANVQSRISKERERPSRVNIKWAAIRHEKQALLRFHDSVSSCSKELLRLCLAFLFFASVPVSWSAELDSAPIAAPRFLGELSCSSSGCHGGAKAGFDQFTAWKQRDVHTRAYATLTTPRSQRIGELLKIEQPTSASRCTACHAPFHEVPAPLRRDEKARAEVGVSCESCHGAAEPWLRSHARPDFSHADRVAAGLVDLKNPYQRANVCVACHQHLEPDLRNAGHPPLLFELDGQCVTQPRHWRERGAGQGTGGQLWVVGQAAALREMSWHLEHASTPDVDPSAIARWQALLWLLARAANAITNFPQFADSKTDATPANFQRVRELSDALARAAAELAWSPELNERLIRQLAGATSDFADATVSRLLQASRAERLVLGLDRVFVAIGKGKDREAAVTAADTQLKVLFKYVQSLPDFDSATFAKALAAFSQALPP